MATGVVALALFLLFAVSAAGAPSDLDSTFGGDGLVTTSIGSGDTSAVALGPGGKIVVAGSVYVGDNDFLVLRYNDDGSLDTNFGGDGIVTVDLAPGYQDDARGVAVDAFGNVVAAGLAYNGSDLDFAVARFLADGTLDTSFAGDGTVMTSFGPSSNDNGYEVVLQGGKILVAGDSDGDFALARYNADGTLDAGFDGDGRLTTDFGGSDSASDVAIDGSGRIVAAGYADVDFAVARYSSSGALDATFDGDGRVTTDFGGNFDFANAVGIGSGDTVVVAGSTTDGSNKDFAIARYSSAGALDGTFDGDGRQTLDFGVGNDSALGVAVDGAGRVVLGGTATEGSSPGFAVARVDASGAPDTTFDTDGRLVQSFGLADTYSGQAWDVVVDGGGRILASGSVFTSSSGDHAALARYAGGSAGPPVIYPTLDPQAPPKDATWAWGYGGGGGLGTGSTSSKLLPAEVSGLTGVTALAGGEYHSVALRMDGTVWAWGFNGFGQLGDGTQSTRTLPVQVSGLTNVTAVSGGGEHSLALRTDGTVRAWGGNFRGQLGDGTTTQRTLPTQVSGLTNVAAIDGGLYHSLALRTDGTVRAWGSNDYGRLGDGTTTDRLLPVQVSGLTGATAVSGGGFHSLALRTDGTVWAWGMNAQGQLGNGTTNNSTLPVQVSGLTNVVGVAAGQTHSLALRADGTVWAWGDGRYGQLGDGTTNNRTLPVQVTGLTNVTAIVAPGPYHSLVLRADGTVWAWGDGSNGQLGDGATMRRTVPVQVSGLTNVTAVSGGGFHSLAVARASPTQGTESFTANVPAGATVTTDVESDGATASDPVETTLTTPFAGQVSVAETTSLQTGDFSVAGRVVEITAPAATAADPLLVRFRLDASVFPVYWPLSYLSVYRNAAVVADCTAPGATPDPCVDSRTRFPDNDVEIVVHTSSASRWIAGRTSPTVDAGGAYTLAEGSSVSLAGSATGGEAPLAFQWFGEAGELSNPAVEDPTFTGRDDATFALSLFVTDAAGLTGTDQTTVTVTNALPAVGAIQASAKKLKVNTQLKVNADFNDPGTRDIHTATWSWGDGKNAAGSVTESAGSGRVTGTHVFQKTGTYTITLTVRDDDGGIGQRTLVVEVTR